MRAFGRQKASVRRVGILVLREHRRAGTKFQKIEKISEIPESFMKSVSIIKKKNLSRKLGQITSRHSEVLYT